MKKLLIVLAVIALSANSLCYAEKNWFDVELAKIRNVKDTRCRMIDSELAQIATVTTRLQTDMSLSAGERQEQLALYNSRRDALNSQKLSIERQYKADKETLKNRWKSGNTKSDDIVSKWVYDKSIGNIIPDESYTYTKKTVTTYPSREYTNTPPTNEMIPVRKTTTTTITTQGRQPVQTVEYRDAYGPKETVNEKADFFVTPEQKNVDPSKFKVILH